MKSAASAPNTARVGPHSRALRRGVVGDQIDGRSREGRFLRACEAELVTHVGGSPSITQRLMIRRAARAMLRLELFDAKLASGNWSDHDGRTFGGLQNAVRLMLRELGLKAPAKDRAPSLAEIAARHRGAVS
jgi:hypothetical protein